jgi:hypothetical protein
MHTYRETDESIIDAVKKQRSLLGSLIIALRAMFAVPKGQAGCWADNARGL